MALGLPLLHGPQRLAAWLPPRGDALRTRCVRRRDMAGDERTRDMAGDERTAMETRQHAFKRAG